MTNVIVIMSDQQRADSLGCLGNRIARTPNLDALASRGAVLQRHFAANQICSPSRATLFSGYYARHHGLTHNGIALPEDLKLLTHDLKAANYRTHGVGKFHFQPILAPAEYAMPDSNAFWSHPMSQRWRGPFYGFDTVDIVIGESAVAAQAGHYAAWLARTEPKSIDLYLPENALGLRPNDLDEVWKCAVPEALHYNSWIADRACDFLSEVNGRFFLFVSFPDPHHPFSPPAPWCDLFDPAGMLMPDVVPGELDVMPSYVRDTGIDEAESCEDEKSYLQYLLDPGPPREQGFMQATTSLSEQTIRQIIAHTYGMVSMIDCCVGRIIATLTTRGLADDTIILFTSDHGELLGDHGLIRKGAVSYRQLLQVPMIIAGPSIAPGPRVQLTSHVDVRATVLDLLNVSGNRGDGLSFAPLLRQPTMEGRSKLYAEFHPRTVPDLYNQTLINGNWRLTIYPGRLDWGELFDWQNDPGEHKNLYFHSAYASLRNHLIQEITSDWPPRPKAGLKPLAVY